MKISIILADDHDVVRAGMRALLESVPDFAVVGEASDGLDAVKLVEKHKPDVLVLDLMMGGLGGLEVLRIIRQQSPETRVVMLSMHSNNAFVGEAVKLGACAYVLKDNTVEHLVRAIRDCLAGKCYLSPPLSQEAVDTYIEQSRAGRFDPHETLTKREREVLQLSAEGRTSTEIAARLHISHRTVENHRANLMRKLKLQKLSDLVRYAMRHKLIPLEE
jgi:DNA-binding NarL/FixJ family response regulator